MGDAIDIRPALDDPNWQSWETFPFPNNRPQWVIWNHGGGRRIVGSLSRSLSRCDDVEAWQPCVGDP